MSGPHEVLVAGGGPVGLMVAAELALAGVDVAVLERRASPDLTIKAGFLTGAVVTALDRRGLLEPALEVRDRYRPRLSAGPRRPGPPTAGHLAGFPLRLDLVEPDDSADSAPVAPPVLLLPQHELETLLRTRVADLGVPVHRGVEVRDVAAGDDLVELRDAAGTSWTAPWLVAADGGRSTVRREVGVAFPGTDAEITGRQALVDLADADEVPTGWNHGSHGVWCRGPQAGRILTVEFDGPPPDRDAPVTREELERSLRHVTGTRARVTAVHSATRWTDHTRQVASYRAGRVLLAGDAAHVHPPFGGQGLGLGIGDAMNLGWKLAAVVRGWEPPTQLDTYDPERRPAGEAVLELTRAQVALMRPDEKTIALRRFAGRVLDTPAGATAAAGLLAGAAVRLPFASPTDDPLVGLPVPEVRLDDGRRLAEVARDGRFTRVVTSAAQVASAPDDPRTTVVRGPRELLVRPDGVVAATAPARVAQRA